MTFEAVSAERSAAGGASAIPQGANLVVLVERKPLTRKGKRVKSD